MPTSAKLLPCSNLSSSGLYMTGKLSAVTVLMISALTSSLLTCLRLAICGGTSSSPLELGSQLPGEVGDQVAAQRLDVERRRQAVVPVHRGPHGPDLRCAGGRSGLVHCPLRLPRRRRRSPVDCGRAPSQRRAGDG